MNALRMLLRASVVTLGLALTLTGCRRGESPPQGRDSTPAPAPTRQFHVRGVVHEVRVDDLEVVVAHEAIPGYMMAMTMPFEVKDPKELTGLERGDRIQFRLQVTAKEGWIDQVRSAGERVALPAPAPEGTRQVPMVEPLAVGDLLPDYGFTNQLGQPFTLRQFRGRALGFVFFFTRCPYPNFCPRMSAQFAEAARRLAALPQGPSQWHLLSISFDPAHDTPPVLRAYAERQGYDPQRWTFATGAMPHLDALTEQFGMSFARAGEFFDHNLRTVVVDREGRVSKILTGNEWSVDEFVAAMVEAAAPGAR